MPKLIIIISLLFTIMIVPGCGNCRGGPYYCVEINEHIYQSPITVVTKSGAHFEMTRLTLFGNRWHGYAHQNDEIVEKTIKYDTIETINGYPLSEVRFENGEKGIEFEYVAFGAALFLFDQTLPVIKVHGISHEFM